MTPAQKLRQILAKPGSTIAPGAANALTARIIEEAGFETLLFSGAGFANLDFGVPDLGLITMTEVVQQVARITSAVEIPVLVDGDTGYGGYFNVRRTVRELERVGAAAIILEDQVFPKRCGHFEGKEVIDSEEMLATIKAATEGRHNPDTVIVARTDARAMFGIHTAIERAQLYAEAGADVTFVEAPVSVEELALIPQRIKVPQIVNLVEGGKTPILPAQTLESMGFKLILYANSALRAAVKAMQIVLEALARDGTTKGVTGQIIGWEERQRLVRLADYVESKEGDVSSLKQSKK